MEIAVVGTGYVGLVAGLCFADVGHDVTCVDQNLQKIEALKAGQIPIFEPGLKDLLESAQSRLHFTTDLREALQGSQVVFIAVGTPEAPDGTADLGPLFSVLREIGQEAKEPKFIVLKSTVPVGTSRKVAEYLDQNSDQAHEVINNPEFLREGAAVDDFLKPDRVVVGCQTEASQRVMNQIYEPFTGHDSPLLFMSNTSAELTKYGANAFLSVKISFANELAALADKVGADMDEVRAGFTSDHRINPEFFSPGSGYGGSCFPKDVSGLLIHTATAHGFSTMGHCEGCRSGPMTARRPSFFDQLMEKVWRC